MEDLTKIIGAIALFFITIFGVSLLSAHIILDVAKLFAVPFVSTLTLSQAYGLGIVVSLFKGYANTKDDEETSPYMKVVIGIAVLLGVWGIAYMAHAILF